MRTLIALTLVFSSVSTMGADDWPQWMGPKRDNVWRETGLIEKFPEKGPKVVWRVPVQIGYAGPAVVGDRVLVTDFASTENVKVPNFNRKAFKGTERVLCLDRATGKVVWKHSYPASYDISYPSGPRCTPTVDNGKVYALGAVGHLLCLDLKSGKVLWSKDFVKEYKTKPALWGYANHPMVYGDSLICIVGGAGSHVVAFDKTTGKELWRSGTAKEQGYSPPTIIKAGGVEQLIVTQPAAVTSLDPKTGKEHWSAAFEATNGCIVMAPVRWKDHLFVGAFNSKNLLLNLGKDKPTATTVWKDKRGAGIAPVNVQPILVDDVMYGFDGNGKMYAAKFPSGERLWDTVKPVAKRVQGTESAFIVKNEDRFWLFNDSGELIIAKLTPKGYNEIDRAKIIEPTNNAFGRQVVWCVPAFAHKCAFVRNDKELICVSLAK